MIVSCALHSFSIELLGVEVSFSFFFHIPLLRTCYTKGANNQSDTLLKGLEVEQGVKVVESQGLVIITVLDLFLLASIRMIGLAVHLGCHCDV